jgi:hypothetical protein
MAILKQCRATLRERRPHGFRRRREHRRAAREGTSRGLRLCGVTVLVCALLAGAAGSVVASPYPLGESSVTPTPGSALKFTARNAGALPALHSAGPEIARRSRRLILCQ